MQQAIDRLGYRPNRNAQSLRTGESRLIGLRVDPVRTPSGGVLDRFLHALAEGSRAHGYPLAGRSRRRRRRTTGPATATC